MVIARRQLYFISAWIRKNRPSGVLAGWLIFFIVAYAVIVKLDTIGHESVRHVTDKIQPSLKHEISRFLTERPLSKNSVERTHMNIIPKNILDDFDQDNKAIGHNAHKLYGGGSRLSQATDEPMIDLAGGNDNELELNHEMEGQEAEIDKHWSNYLDKNKNVVNTNDKDGHKMSNHLRFQGLVKKHTNVSRVNTILPRLPKYVHVFDALREEKKFRDAVSNNKCVLLKTMHGDSPICIHDPQDDEIISAHLFENGAWEPNFLYITGNILKLEPELLFLDLGCNIGVYTILAAKLGKTVVAVDPNKQNLRLLTKSLSLGNIRDKVILLWNAISNTHENVTLVEIVGNVGGTFVDDYEGIKSTNDETTVTITLDDLSGLFKDKPVFIKMDIETFEWKAIKGAAVFFKEVDVRYILMEWIAHRGSDSGKNIINFLTKLEFYPHVNNHHNTKLDIEHARAWPDNVLWIKY